MKRIGVLILLTLGLFSCGDSAATVIPSPSPVQHSSLSINGQMRTYRLFRPPSLDPKQPAPLVVQLHGCVPGADGDFAASFLHFDDVATSDRFVAVYPDGINNCWNGGRCCTHADDVTFISRLLDRLVKDLPIDQSRIFVTGASGGGFMSYRLACELFTRIAAIASVSGAMLFGDCRPARSVSVLEMHGTEDSDVPYEGGRGSNVVNSPSIASVIQQWVEIDACGAKPVVGQTGITKTSLWKGCKAGTVVRLDTVVGGHHTWFGSTFDPVPGEPDANAVVWDFFNSLPPRS